MCLVFTLCSSHSKGSNLFCSLLSLVPRTGCGTQTIRKHLWTSIKYLHRSTLPDSSADGTKLKVIRGDVLKWNFILLSLYFILFSNPNFHWLTKSKSKSKSFKVPLCLWPLTLFWVNSNSILPHSPPGPLSFCSLWR
jgi:hypothetical protein